MTNPRCYLGWIVILLLGLPSQAVLAQDGGALVRADPPVLEVGQGQIETLQILLVNAENVYGIDLQVRFDPAVVEVVDADPRQDGVQMTPGTFLKPDFVALNTANNTTGILRYVVTQLNPTLPANGEGVILVIQFLGKVAGVETSLDIVSVQIADRRGVKQPVTARDADLVAVPPKPPTPTPIPTATPVSTIAASFTPSIIPFSAPPAIPAQPGGSTGQIPPVRASEMKPVLSDRNLIYVAVGGFFGASLLTGLSIWLRGAPRRKERRKRSAK